MLSPRPFAQPDLNTSNNSSVSVSALISDLKEIDQDVRSIIKTSPADTIHLEELSKLFYARTVTSKVSCTRICCLIGGTTIFATTGGILLSISNPIHLTFGCISLLASGLFAGTGLYHVIESCQNPGENEYAKKLFLLYERARPIVVQTMEWLLELQPKQYECDDRTKAISQLGQLSDHVLSLFPELDGILKCLPKKDDPKLSTPEIFKTSDQPMQSQPQGKTDVVIHFTPSFTPMSQNWMTSHSFSSFYISETKREVNNTCRYSSSKPSATLYCSGPLQNVIH